MRRTAPRPEGEESTIHTPMTPKDRTVASQIPRLKVTTMHAAKSTRANPAATRANQCRETKISARASGRSMARVLAKVVGESKVK